MKRFSQAFFHPDDVLAVSPPDAPARARANVSGTRLKFATPAFAAVTAGLVVGLCGGVRSASAATLGGSSSATTSTVTLSVVEPSPMRKWAVSRWAAPKGPRPTVAKVRSLLRSTRKGLVDAD